MLMLQRAAIKSTKLVLRLSACSFSKLPKETEPPLELEPTADAMALRRRNYNQYTSRTESLMPDMPEPPIPPNELGKLNGYPLNYKGRHAIIYRRQESQQFSGKRQRYWCLKFDSIGAEPIPTDPLTGNSQLTDPLRTVNLRFNTVEEAVTFCVRNGIEHDVDLPPTQIDEVKDYGFKVLPKRVRAELQLLGKKKAASYFYYPAPFTDHWLNHYHNTYGTEEWHE